MRNIVLMIEEVDAINIAAVHDRDYYGYDQLM